jgi:hypothetical protein
LAQVNDTVSQFSAEDVAYLLVYITEAHPSDGWAPEKAPEDFLNAVTHARTTEDRLAAARAFAQKADVETTILVDSIDDELENRYEARPDRLYVVKDGKIMWRGGVGPFDYDANGLATFLQTALAPA